MWFIDKMTFLGPKMINNLNSTTLKRTCKDHTYIHDNKRDCTRFSDPSESVVLESCDHTTPDHLFAQIDFSM